MRSRIPALLTFLALLLTFGIAGAQDPEPIPDPFVNPDDVKKYPEPKFKDDSGKEEFDRGMAYFKEGKYREAERAFKNAKRRAVSDEDEKGVEVWMAAAKAGLEILVLERRVKVGQNDVALFQAIDSIKRHGGSPIEEKFQAFIDELRPKVLEVLEDFEFPSGSYSAKYGKSHIKADPKKPGLVAHGRGCLKWAQTKDKKAVQLRISQVPADWSKYEGVIFYIKNVRPVPMEVVAKTSKKKETRDYMLYNYRPSKGKGEWERIFIPLNKFKKQGKGQFTTVESFMFNLRSKRDFEVHIDYVCLVKKPEGRRRRG